MISSLRRMTWSALFGSSAAVCSSSSSSFGLQPRRHQQRQRLPLSARQAADRRCRAGPRGPCSSAADAIADLRRASSRVSAQPRPRGRPRRAASARFSAIDMIGAVPLNGFWKTRPISDARRCSGQRVTSVPSRRIVPASTRNVPATAFSSVDLPEPFVPMTIDERALVDRQVDALQRAHLVGRAGVERLARRR